MVTKVKSGVIGDNTVGITQLNVSDGSNGQVLTTNGSGTLSFTTISGYTDSDVESYLDTSGIHTDPTNNRLGIGVSSPSSALHVEHAVGVPVVTIHNTGGADSSYAGLEVETSTTGSYIQRWVNSGTEHARITGAGRLGIGTTSPSSPLHVSGDCTTSAGNFSFNPGTGNLGQRYMIINAGTSNDGGFILKRDNTNKWQIVNSTTDDDIWFYSYSTSSTLLTLDRSKPGLYVNSTSQGSQSGPFFVQGASGYACTGQFENTNAAGHYLMWSTSGTSRALIGVGSNSGTGDLAHLGIKSHGGQIQFFANNVKHLTLYENGVLAAGTGTSDIGHNIVNYTTSGYIGITGDLTGYSAGSYPVLKSSGNYLYIDIGGSYAAYIGSNGAYTANSDRTLKENITTLSSGQLAKVCSLRGVNFEWIDERETGTQVGLIAQEVQEEYPELVGNGGVTDGTLAVNYAGLVSPLIEAIKELKTELDAAKARITTLEG